MMKQSYVCLVELEKPTLSDNTADAQRLEQALRKQLGAENISIPLHLLKNLQW